MLHAHSTLRTYKHIYDKQQHCRNQKDFTHLVQFDDMGVVQQLHNLHLSVNFFQVGGIQPGLINYLYGHLKNQGNTVSLQINFKCVSFASKKYIQL